MPLEHAGCRLETKAPRRPPTCRFPVPPRREGGRGGDGRRGEGERGEGREGWGGVATRQGEMKRKMNRARKISMLILAFHKCQSLHSISYSHLFKFAFDLGPPVDQSAFLNQTSVNQSAHTPVPTLYLPLSCGSTIFTSFLLCCYELKYRPQTEQLTQSQHT